MRYLARFLLLVLSVNVQARPRIDSMTVDENRDQLLIYGEFGNKTGSVTIEGQPQKIVRWMPQWIRCALPRNGRGSSGPVLVADTEGYLSEPRKITEMGFDLLIEWRPTNSTTPDVHHYEARMHHLRIRADVESRLQENALPVIPFEVTGYASSTVSYQQGFSSRSYGSSISTGGSLDWADTNRAQGLSGSGEIDLLTASIKLKLRSASQWPRFFSSWYVSGVYHDQYDRTYDTSIVDFSETLDLQLALDKDLAIRPVYEKHIATQIRSIAGVQYQVDSVFMLTPRTTLHAPIFSPSTDPKVVALPMVIDFGQVNVGDTAIRKFAAYVQGAHYWQGPYQSHISVSFDSAFTVLNTPPLYYSTIVPALDSMIFCFIPRDAEPADGLVVVTAGAANDSIGPAYVNVRGNFPKANVRSAKTISRPRIVVMAGGYSVRFEKPYRGMIEIRNSIGQLVKDLEVGSSNVVSLPRLSAGWYQVLASDHEAVSFVIR